ncbi:MAG TPA: serine/threonine-protein kinase [Pseudomonadota bacterium]|nr:serine/threonine-protein kinase [Pseudomonadota bacterium]
MPADSQSATLPEPGLAGSSRPDAMVGRVLKEKYRVEAQLGQGAMGVVYRGTQLGLGKTVAIKMIRADILVTKDSHDRFSREAQVLSKLLHPGIAQVLDFGIEDGTPFLVMEFVDGKELTEVMQLEGPMAPIRAIAIVRQLAAALEEAHRNGVVHRDIKPHNIRLQRYSPTGPIYLKVLDFGIAKQLGDENGTSLTATGAVIGTPAYMAPEQAGGTKIDARADQYAVGIVLYELLTGTVPFVSDTVTGVLVSHLTKPPPPLPREVPEPLQRIVMRLLEKEPSGRYADISSVEKALADCEGYCRDARPLAKGTIRPTVAGTALVGGNKRSTGTILGAAVLAAVVVSGVILGSAKLRGRHDAAGGDGAKASSGQGSAGVAAATVNPAGPGPAAAASNPPVGPSVTTNAGADKGTTTAADRPAETKPADKPVTDKPTTTGNTTGSKPHAAGAGSGLEPPAVKEQLDRAEKLLQDGDYPKAIELARQTTFTHPTPRAFRQLTYAHCKMGNFVAKATFFKVAPADRKKLIAVCQENGVLLR